MRALTLYQPWASLMAQGNRSSRPGHGGPPQPRQGN